MYSICLLHKVWFFCVLTLYNGGVFYLCAVQATCQRRWLPQGVHRRTDRNGGHWCTVLTAGKELIVRYLCCILYKLDGGHWCTFLTAGKELIVRDSCCILYKLDGAKLMLLQVKNKCLLQRWLAQIPHNLKEHESEGWKFFNI